MLYFLFFAGRYFLFREYKKNAFSVICTLRAFLRQKLYVRNRGLKLLEGLPVDFGRGAGGLAVELGAHTYRLVEETAHFQVEAVVGGFTALVVKTHLGIGGGIVGKGGFGYARPLALGVACPLVAEEHLTRQVALFGIEVFEETVGMGVPGVGLRTQEAGYQLPFLFLGGIEIGGVGGVAFAVGTHLHEETVSSPAFQG